MSAYGRLLRHRTRDPSAVTGGKPACLQAKGNRHLPQQFRQQTDPPPRQRAFRTNHRACLTVTFVAIQASFFHRMKFSRHFLCTNLYITIGIITKCRCRKLWQMSNYFSVLDSSSIMVYNVGSAKRFNAQKSEIRRNRK